MQFATYNDNPLLLQFTKPLPGSTSKLLPVTIYESTIEIIGGEAQVVLVPTAYEIETGEAERVAVDHASKPEAGATGAGSSCECWHAQLARRLDEDRRQGGVGSHARSRWRPRYRTNG